MQLFRQLHAADEAVCAATRAELRRRNYRTVHIELGRRLTDPSPAVRRELADRLPRVPGVDAIPWLQQLARDEDSDVRATALSILATSADPAIQKWVRDAVRNETDQRVSQQLQQVLPAR